jgi:hypothetical protein
MAAALVFGSFVAIGAPARATPLLPKHKLLVLTYTAAPAKLASEDHQGDLNEADYKWSVDDNYVELRGDLSALQGPASTLHLAFDKIPAVAVACPPLAPGVIAAPTPPMCFQLTGKAGDVLQPNIAGAGGPVATADAFKLIDSVAPAGGGVGSGYDRDAELRAAYNDAVAQALKLKGLDAKGTDKLPLCATGSSICPVENAYSPGDDVAVVMFNEKGESLFPLPQVDENDAVFVVIVPDEDKVIGEFRVTTCDAANPLRIAGSAVVPGVGASAAPGKAPPPVRRYKIVLARGCAKENGIKAIVGIKGDTGTHDIPIKTLGLARITIGLGLVYDFSLEREFRADPVKGENVPVIVKDEHVRGLVPPIPFVMLRPFSAVPAERSRRFSEMWGIGAGFSLTAPLDHVYLGGLFEPYPGLGAVFGYHLHREPTLAGGYVEGDRLPSGQVPTDKRWEATGRDWFLGLNVDASVFASIIGLITPK